MNKIKFKKIIAILPNKNDQFSCFLTIYWNLYLKFVYFINLIKFKKFIL
jgi:hypothetical protein